MTFASLAAKLTAAPHQVLGGAFFRHRIPLPSRILGGAALGVATGVLTHIAKNHADGTLDSTVQGILGMKAELKEGVNGTDKIPLSEDEKRRRKEMEASDY